MKRKILFIAAIVLCACTALICLVGCDKHTEDTQNDNICRITNSFYAGESDEFYVSIEQGRREKAFIADGVARDVEAFTELTILPLKSNSFDNIAYMISGGDSTLSGEVRAGRHGEFAASIQLDFIPDKIMITASDTTSELDLSSVLEGALSGEDAINIARDALKESIDREYNEGKPEREIYVKLISADRMNYYYYVSFIGDGVDYWAMLINPQTGEIVSKKQ